MGRARLALPKPVVVALLTGDARLVNLRLEPTFSRPDPLPIDVRSCRLIVLVHDLEQEVIVAVFEGPDLPEWQPGNGIPPLCRCEVEQTPQPATERPPSRRFDLEDA